MQTFCHINVSLEQHLADAIIRQCEKTWADNLCRCVPMLVDMIISEHEKPVKHFEPAIREMIIERCVIGAAPTCHRCDPHVIDRHVRLLLGELEHIRSNQLEQGDWSDAPVPPLMCG
ncbi:hypothetical protein HED60_08835 [Planctomycetales bacterium ZRK34]|nr:hypothetical protein HED60_08835 [Planctomycetales bacterium ZRK34]